MYETEDNVFIVMDRFDGDLKSLLQDNENILSVKDKLDISTQITAGIVFFFCRE